MKRHLLAIFTYFVTFFVSFLLVVLLSPKQPISPVETRTACFPKSLARLSSKPAPDTAEQKRIRELLSEDRWYGLAYFAEKENAKNAVKLVGQMESLDNEELPSDIRRAYRLHTDAWRNYAQHLSEQKNSLRHDFSDEECAALSAEINRTYGDLLDAARMHGVDFRK